MHSPCRLFIVFCWLLVSPLAAGIDHLSPFLSAGDLDEGPIRPTVWYLKDPTHTMTLEEAQQKLKDGAFRKENPNFNFGYQDAAYWFVFVINVPRQSWRERQRDIVIELDYPHLDRIEFHKLASDDTVMRELVMGDSLPFPERPLDNNLYAVPDKVLTGLSYQYWIRVDTSSSVQLHPSIWDKNQYLESRDHTQLVYGFYFGILAIMALYNLFIGFKTRDRSYFYYFGYILCFCVLQACLWGYAFQYLWPHWPSLNSFALPNSMLGSLMLAIAFARSFLQTRIHSPTHDRLLLLAILAGSGMLLINFVISNELRIRLAIWTCVFGIILLLHAGVAVARQGVHSAKLFMWAWTTMLLGAAVYGLTALGLLPSNFFTRHASQIGSALEVILLSFALADRINRIKAEKRAVEVRAKQALESKNRELKEALLQLTKSNSLKDEFLATISHELRTPMNGIEGSLQIVRHSVQDDTSKAHIDAAFHSAHHMTQLVESLLEYSELQSGNWQLNEQLFNLEELIKKSTNNIRQEYVSRNLTFNLHTDIQLSHLVKGDQERLQHLLFQLLDNAFKFTYEGSVTLDVSASESPEQDTCHISIQISDTGIGIAPSQLKTIFEGFRQIDGSFSRQYGGLGIGLSICKAIVDRMNGQLSVESLPDRGTRFTIELNLEKAEKIEKPEPDQKQLPDTPRLLVVEDNPVNQMTLIAMAKKMGCEVSKANNGEEAVRLCYKESFDIILMDCQMPIMDGFDATRAIRAANNANSHIPILAVTANAMSGDRERCLAAGMNDYIKKPIKMEEIRSRLYHWLANKAA
ncbi:MAG: 7TM diverse intracellular signaling domain-containing protein [Ketobacteraceae bacterium]|nr:7TM diverse intracellular signaling domain-containing protein [Ketobacteraceae bacterium]